MTNLNPEQVNQARTILENSRSILMAIPANSTIDKVAAALSLYLSLSASGKQVSIVSPMDMTVEFNRLIGIDKISTALNSQNGRNLIISFPYQEGSIEKVSYNIENDTFNLVIEPREGYPTITSEMMRYNFSGGNYEAIVTIGCTNPTDLGQIHSINQNLFNEKPVINIDYDNSNSSFGKVNLIDPTVTSMSELILGLMEQMGLPIEPDMATNLLTGIIAETDNFSSPTTTAGTFETAAVLMKYGAKKVQTSESKSETVPQFPKQDKKQDQFAPKRMTSPFEKPLRIPFGRQASPSQTSPAAPYPSQTGMSPQSAFKSKSQSKFQTQPQPPTSQPPFGKTNQQQQQQPQPQQQPSTREADKPPETPPDWLKPKIYKGSTLL